MSELELAILAFEGEWWRHASDKQDAIERNFGMTATCYYQILNQLIDTPDALQADPLTTRRLRRTRATRRRRRARIRSVDNLS